MTEPQMEQTANVLLDSLIQRPLELGRIRMGEKSQAGHPVRLKTFRLTSVSKSLLEAAAVKYGGTVRPWPEAPDEGFWQLVTGAAELNVLIPASFGVISQSLELWKGGTCERRCDEKTESISGKPCLCAAEGFTGAERPCELMTRLRVMMPDLPGLGVWRLDTSGFQAATTLPSTISLLTRLTPGQWVPAVLRAEQRSKKERQPDGKVQTHRFVVPVLDLPNGVTIGAIVGGAVADPPELGEGEKPKPLTAEERVAAKRAELESAGGAQDGRTTETSGEGKSEGAQSATPSGGTSEPALPLPRGACPSTSPRGESCRLALGHDGDHRAGNKRWPETLSKPDGSVGASQSHGQAALTADDETSASGVPLADDLAGVRNVTPDPVPADVQAGLDLLDPRYQKGDTR